MAEKSSPTLLPPEVVLGALLDWLEFTKTPSLIIGGIAASLLGRPRFSQDIKALGNSVTESLANWPFRCQLQRI